MTPGPGGREPSTTLTPLARDAALRLWRRAADPDLQDLAAGLAFRLFLALFPFCIFVAALGGSLARLLGTRSPVDEMLALLGDLPIHLADLIRRELTVLLEAEQPGLLSIGALATLGISVNGASALVRAMDRAYRVSETRPAWERTLLAIGLTLLAGGVLVLGFGLLVLGDAAAQAVALRLDWRWSYDAAISTVQALRWIALPALIVLALAFLYRAAPNLPLRWRGVLPGAVLFTAGWLLATWLFSVYVTAFGSYGATYGTLSGGVILLLWLYATALLLLLGAELNAYLDERLNTAWVRAHRALKLKRKRELRRARLARRLGPLGRHLSPAEAPAASTAPPSAAPASARLPSGTPPAPAAR